MKSLAVALATLGLTQACLTPAERRADMERNLYGAPLQPINPARRQFGGGDTGYPIGSGDRFKGGSVLPQGAGTTTNKDFRSILNINEVQSGLKALANTYSNVKLWSAPQKTFEGRTMSGITVGDNPRVFIEGGIHARERGGPDYVLYFIADLLAAAKAGTGVKYGDSSYTANDVKTALGAGLVILPLVNPDGVNYDQKSNTCWRKNRNTASATEGDDDTVGIDLNRNFDFLWDFRRQFNANVGSSAASDNPAAETFHGTAPNSEAETQNVAWVMDQYASLSWFLDLHSFAGDILYAWGDDDWQTTDKTMNFTNTAYDKKRGITGNREPSNSKYKEYIQTVDINAQKDVTSKMANAMNNAASGSGSTSYQPLQSSNLYPTSGGSNDYALGRYYRGTCGASKINGLAVEFGAQSGLDCPFYPDEDMYVGSMNQVAAGFMEFVLYAAGSGGKPVVVKC